MLKVLDLFSGIGGFSLGLERTGGFETVAFCEIDPFCQKVLKKHWPDVPIYNDVRNLDYDGAVDVITGGYPCQPFSTAGKRKGKEDDRHLWPAMFDLIKKHRPDWVIGENVAGHIGMGLDEVLDDLESADYQARSFVIPAVSVNAPHRRDRLWTVANAKELQCNGREFDAQHSKRETVQEFGNRSGAAIISDTNSGNGQSGKQDRKQEDCAEDRSGMDNRTSRHGNLRNVGEHWSFEPAVGRVVNGIPNRVHRLKALGNAVVPQIPEMIGYAILEAEKETQ